MTDRGATLDRCPAGFTPTAMIRSATNDVISTEQRTPAGQRRPKNVPLLVDNLWEWARPPGYPSRRRSAFASPSAELALRFGAAGGVACRVFLRAPYRVVQLVGCRDARFHPDVTRLSTLSSDAVPGPVRHRFLPDAKEVDELLVPLGRRRIDDLRSRITLWTSAALLVDPTTEVDEEGEFFFEATGYLLHPLDDS